MAQNRLFAVYLGGRAPKCNTELHDVVFVTGASIDNTYDKLIEKWFGTPDDLHLDSWTELDLVDGYRVTLSSTRIDGPKKLYFVNLGAYKNDEFTEIHANKFLVAETMQEAKSRAKNELLGNWPSRVHTDDIHDIDDCIELQAAGDFHIVLTKTDEEPTIRLHNGYYPIPKSAIDQYMTRLASGR